FSLAQGVEALVASAIFGDPLAGEFALLNVGEHLFHGLAGGITDDGFATGEVAIFGGVGDGVAHAREAAFVDEIDDQLDLVETLEVGDLGLVAGLDKGFKALLDE